MAAEYKDTKLSVVINRQKDTNRMPFPSLSCIFKVLQYKVSDSFAF